jgi:hypothetical protein
MYKDLNCVVWNNNFGKTDIRKWLEALDPQAVASIRKFQLFFPDCSTDCCYFAIFPGEVNEEVAELSNRSACKNTCPLRQYRGRRAEKRIQLKKLVKELPLVDNGKRREITKETLADMLKVMGFMVDAESDDHDEFANLDWTWTEAILAA